MGFSISLVFNKKVTINYTNIPVGLKGTLKIYLTSNRNLNLNTQASYNTFDTLYQFTGNEKDGETIKLTYTSEYVSEEWPFLLYEAAVGETFTTTGVENGYKVTEVFSYEFVNDTSTLSATRRGVVFKYSGHDRLLMCDCLDATATPLQVRSMVDARGGATTLNNVTWLSYVNPKVETTKYTCTFKTGDNVSVSPSSITSDGGDVVFTPASGYVFDDTGVVLSFVDDQGHSTGAGFKGWTSSGDTSRITVHIPAGLIDDNYTVMLDFPTVSQLTTEHTATFSTIDNVTVNPSSLSSAGGNVVIQPVNGYAFDDTNVVISIISDSGFDSGETFKGWTSSGDTSKITINFPSGLIDDNYKLKITFPTVSKVGSKTVDLVHEGHHCTINGVSQLTVGTTNTFNATPDDGYTVKSIAIYQDNNVLVSSDTNTLTYTPAYLETTSTYKIVAIAEVIKPDTPDKEKMNVNTVWLLDDKGMEALNGSYFTTNLPTSTNIVKLLSDYCMILARIPFVITPDGQRQFELGSITTSIKQYYTKEHIFTFDFGSIEIKRDYDNYTSYNPYVVYSLWLPMYGYENIPSDDIVNHTISIKLHYNVYNGSGCYVISNELSIIAVANVKVAMDIPLKQREADGITQNMMASQLSNNMNVFFIKKDYGCRDLTNNGKIAGFENQEVSKVKDHKGYLECDKVDLNGLSLYSIFSKEIEQLLLSGVIV